MTPPSPAELAALPLFPLPEAALFPGQLLPLHLFEPRYRALAEHCVARELPIALGALAPGYEADYHGRPPVLPVLGVGRIVAQRRLEDGRWNLALKGAGRARLVSEHAPTEPFRVVRAEALADVTGPGDEGDAGRLRAVVLQLAERIPPARVRLGELLESATTPGLLADVVAGHFVEAFAERRTLLEELRVAVRLGRLGEIMGRLLLELSFGDGEVPTPQ